MATSVLKKHPISDVPLVDHSDLGFGVLGEVLTATAAANEKTWMSVNVFSSICFRLAIEVLVQGYLAHKKLRDLFQAWD